MCGRFLFVARPADVAELFGVPEEPSLFPEPRYNIAPGQTVPVVVEAEGSRRAKKPDNLLATGGRGQLQSALGTAAAIELP